jgi:uncharacterized iron-regulated membrane protein
MSSRGESDPLLANTSVSEGSRAVKRAWPDYAAVWRWHFYAGLFCIPFICWLAITGSIYLFRPDIEGFLDRPYESLQVAGPRAAPSREAEAAIAAVPGSVFTKYQPPATPTGAAQVVVTGQGHPYRVYIHPGTLSVMKIQRDDQRPMDVVAHLHGQLLLGNRGSMLVELAASWAVVMIITGLYLWLPRGRWRLAGMVYPRLGLGGRQFWRDLHAVTGLWVSMITLFMLLSGLPWSSNWGHYLTWLRNHWSVTAGAPDWPVGANRPPIARRIGPAPLPSLMPGMSAADMAAMAPAVPPMANGARSGALKGLDVVVPVALRLAPPPPVWISPPAAGAEAWTIASQAQNRPLRVSYKVDPDSGAVIGTSNFGKQNIVDKVVNVAIATHEGQLFGRINQAILLFTAVGLLLVSASATVMWWDRRPTHTLGAPHATARPRFSLVLAGVVLGLSVLLPLFGLSLVLVLATEWLLLRRIPKAPLWLGLSERVG